VRCVCGTVLHVLRFAPYQEAGAPPAPLGLAADGTPCAYHAGNAASQACRRCGSFVCSLCALGVGGQSYCPPCLERLQREGGLAVLRSRHERPHAIGLALALLANLLPLVGLLLAPAGIWLGARALRRRGELSERERFVAAKAVSALVLAGLSLALHVGMVALLVRERTP
jgi:hypothetical protein